MNNQLLTIDEVAFLLNISTQTVRKMIREHKLLAIKFGRIYRIPYDSLQQFVNHNQI